MTVHFYANVQEFTQGQKSLEITEAENLHALIEVLGKHFSEDFKTFLLADKTCFFLVNGNGIMSTGGLKTPLRPDDKIEVLPFADGG